MAQADGFTISIDKKAMLTITNNLDKLYPTDSQTNNALAASLKKAALPLKRTLKALIKSKASKTAKERKRLGYSVGKLARSIKIFKAKRLTKAGRPSVYVGPKVKPPKSLTKKEGTIEQKRARAIAWAKKYSGFYFYILEYGFSPRGGKTAVGGLGLLPQTADAAGGLALSLLSREILATLNKRSIKLFGTPVQ